MDRIATVTSSPMATLDADPTMPLALRHLTCPLGPTSKANWHQDSFWQGRLLLWQPKRGSGYRFNIDSILLSAFSAPWGGEDVLELGAGMGIVTILLLASGVKRQAILVERQASLVAMAQCNLAQNHLAQQAIVMHADLRHQEFKKSSCVVFNPPYWAKHSGRMAGNLCMEVARREWFGTLQDFLQAASRSMVPGGTFCFIVPYSREQEALALLPSFHCKVVQRRYVLGQRYKACTHVLLAAQQATSTQTFEQLPDWILHSPTGYPQELQPWLSGQFT